MKKIILLFAGFLLMICAENAYAQEGFGIKFGGNLATRDGGFDFYQPFLAYHFGFVYRTPIADQLLFQTEVAYSLQGYRFAGDSQFGFNYNYINVPLLFLYEFDNDFYAFMGPQVAYLLGVREVFGGVKTNPQVETRDIDFSLVGGFGMNFSENLSGDIRLIYGLSIFAGSDPAILNRFPNRVLQFGLNYYFAR